MSAFMCSQHHIELITRSMLRFSVIIQGQEQKTARLLWIENDRSVKFRYGDKVESLPPPKEFHISVMWEPEVMIVKQVQCYMYQSCQHPKWERSKAKKLCTLLLANIAEQMARAHPSYDAYYWGTP